MIDETGSVTLMHKVGAFIAERINTLDNRIKEVEAKQTPDYANIGTIEDLQAGYNNNLEPYIAEYYRDINVYNDDGSITPVDATVA